MARYILGIILALNWSSICCAQSSVLIAPDQPTGAIVRYFGWDAKLHANLTNSTRSAKRLYGDSPANIMRIPFRPQASTPEGKAVFAGAVKENGYGPLIDSIKMAKQVNPDLKIFASTKLMGADTFPSWMDSSKEGRIFNAPVKCPDVDKFAYLLTDYFEYLAAEGIKIDFLGLNNEVGEALTPQHYVAVAQRLDANLKKSTMADEFKDFQWIGAEEYGVYGSVKYAAELSKLNAQNFVDKLGSHFYPDKSSGSIQDWEKLASFGAPTWHTEVHVRRHENPGENIAALRDGMCIVFATNQLGTEGYIWWDGTANQSFLCNHVRHQMIQSMLYGNCVRTSGTYQAKDNEPTKRIAQATRVGDTVWLWYFNPNQEINELPVKLSSGVIESTVAKVFQGGSRTTPQSQGKLNIKTTSKTDFSVEQIPKQSIVVVEIVLEDDQQLIGLKKWDLIKSKKRSITAALSRVEGNTLFFKSSRGKTISVPAKSLNPKHQPEILDALRAHGIL